MSGHERSSLYRADRHAQILPVLEAVPVAKPGKTNDEKGKKEMRSGFELTEALGGCLIFDWQVPATYRLLALHPFAPPIW